MKARTAINSPPISRMRVTTLATQEQRQRLGPDWEPAGFERYVYQQALLRQMRVLEGVGSNPDRYSSPSACCGTLECLCGGH